MKAGFDGHPCFSGWMLIIRQRISVSSVEVVLDALFKVRYVGFSSVDKEMRQTGHDIIEVRVSGIICTAEENLPMEGMKILRAVLLVFGLGVLLKGVFSVMAPARVQAVTDWWLRLSDKCFRVIGVLMLFLGFGLLGIVIWQMGDLVKATSAVLGSACLLVGLLYLHPPALRTAGRPLGKSGSLTFVRICGVLMVGLGVLILGIWLRG